MSKVVKVYRLDDPNPKRRSLAWKALAFESRVGVSVRRVDRNGAPLLDANGRPITDKLSTLLDAIRGRRARKNQKPRGTANCIAPERIVEAVERHKKSERYLGGALANAVDELEYAGSRDYKDLHSWYMRAKRRLSV